MTIRGENKGGKNSFLRKWFILKYVHAKSEKYYKCAWELLKNKASLHLALVGEWEKTRLVIIKYP